jgi:hypothetical protein
VAHKLPLLSKIKKKESVGEITQKMAYAKGRCTQWKSCLQYMVCMHCCWPGQTIYFLDQRDKTLENSCLNRRRNKTVKMQCPLASYARAMVNMLFQLQTQISNNKEGIRTGSIAVTSDGTRCTHALPRKRIVKTDSTFVGIWKWPQSRCRAKKARSAWQRSSHPRERAIHRRGWA